MTSRELATAILVGASIVVSLGSLVSCFVGAN